MTKTNQLNFFKMIPTSWLVIFIALSFGVAVVSFVYETVQAKSSIEKYVAIWEDDISKSVLFEGDLTLQNKILGQLNEVQNTVTKSQVKDSTSLKCLLYTDAPITFNSLPAGNIRVCFSPAKLSIKALSSPIFVLGLVVSVVLLGFALRREFQNRLQEQKLAAELEMSQQLSSMARQVAHDIRGPLTALATLSKLSHEMSEDKRDLFELAVGRMQGIADDLLQKGRKQNSEEGVIQGEASSAVAAVSSQHVLKVVEDLIKEFRFSHQSVQFSISSHLNASYALDVETIKFQRILSNLINNAIEACAAEDAFVGIQLQASAQGVSVQVMDNGCGIPEERLKELGQEGVTFGKSKGNGLGLYDAKASMVSCGGDLTIQSRVGIGTQVTLQIPAQAIS